MVWNKCEGLEKRVKSCEHVAVSQTAGIDSFLSKTLSKGWVERHVCRFGKIGIENRKQNKEETEKDK